MTIEWNNIRTLIWDLDGTLVDSAADIGTAVNLVLADYQLDALPDNEIRQMIGHGAAKLLDRAFAAVNGLAVYERDKAYQQFLSYYEQHCCDRTTFYPGIKGVVVQCAEQGLQQGVCTNKPHQMAEQILTHLKIREYFSVVVGGDTTPFRKPHAQPLMTCMEALNIDSQTTLMIGDSAADVGVARAAGVPVALLPWGYTAIPAADLGADAMLEDAAALLRKLPTNP